VLPTWVVALKSLSPSHAPQLVAAAVVAGVVWLLVPDQRLAVAAFLAQRAIVLILPWPEMSDSYTAVGILAWFAVAVIFTGSVWSARARQGCPTGRSMAPRSFRVNALFRAVAASLTVLLARWLVQTYSSLLPPPLIAFTAIWLITQGVLALLLAGSGLGVGLGVLTFADGCRTFYGLAQPNLWIWAVWSIGDILAAWAAAHLLYAEAIASRCLLQEPP
jgi:hypothetical protein